MTTTYISRSQEVMGGQPVIAGTRIPVERLSQMLRQGYTETAVKKEFSHIPKEKIRGALYELSILGIEKLAETRVNGTNKT